MATSKVPRTFRTIRTSFDPGALQADLHEETGGTEERRAIIVRHAMRDGKRLARCRAAGKAEQYATPEIAHACRVELARAGYSVRVVSCSGDRRHWHLRPTT